MQTYITDLQHHQDLSSGHYLTQLTSHMLGTERIAFSLRTPATPTKYDTPTSWLKTNIGQYFSEQEPPLISLILSAVTPLHPKHRQKRKK